MAEPWRWRCPANHTNWRKSGQRYYCKSCETYFDELVDLKTAKTAEVGTV